MGHAGNKKNASTEAGSLTPAQLRHLPRPRGGFDVQLEGMIALYRIHPEELYLKDATPDELEAALAAYRAMVSAENEARRELAAMENARRVKGSGLWSNLLELYARAQVASRTDSVMKRGIAAVAQFMRHRRKRDA